eukprot:3996931-Pyramimonas_sp.AAC.1
MLARSHLLPNSLLHASDTCGLPRQATVAQVPGYPGVPGAQVPGRCPRVPGVPRCLGARPGARACPGVP